MSSRAERIVDIVRGVTSLATSIEFWKYMLLSRPDKVRRLAVYMVAIATVFGGTGFYMIVINPKLLVRLLVWMNRRKCGFKTRRVTSARGFTYSYAERGVRGRTGQPSLVLVPGLGGTIENWVSVVKAMSNTNLHIIAVEMPGSGDTSCEPSRDLNIKAQVDRLHLFLELTRLAERPVHLVGAATGGTVVGCYAAKHPEGVAKLTLICPAVRSPIDSDAIRAKKEGRDIGLIPRSAAQIPTMMQVLSLKSAKIPRQLMKGIFDLKIKPSLEYTTKLSDSMFEDIWAGDEDTLLTPCLHQIKAPTRIIWGRYDRVIHVSGAELIKEKLANCVGVDIINCGHSIYIDEPRTLARLIQDFATTT